MNAIIRPLDEADLPEADRIFRLAFGTFFGLPDPMSFAGDADVLATRRRVDPSAILGAYIEDKLVGSNVAVNWGSFGYFGPLTVHPDLWDKGIAQQLLAATMEIFERWGTRQAALFTIPQSTKHIGLYQKFGFWPQYLTPLMAKPVVRSATPARASTFSDVPSAAREVCIADCGALTNAVYPGLDLQREIRAVSEQGLGETVLVYQEKQLVAFAVCHIGKGTEAGSGTAFVKFGAARPNADVAQHFSQLLSGVEALAAGRGLERILAGINTARHHAYRMMIARGFRATREGVAMQRPNDPGFNRADCFVIDDWR